MSTPPAQPDESARADASAPPVDRASERDESVSMSKSPKRARAEAAAPPDDTEAPAAGDAGTEDAAAPPPPAVPRSINLAAIAICVQVFLMLVRAGSMFGYTGELTRLLIKSNNDLKPADRKVPYGPQQVADDLHRVRLNGLWTTLIVAVALLLLAWSLRRVGTATVTRWALIIVMVMTGGPFSIIPASGFPVVPQAAGVLSGVAALVAIVLLFMPDSRAYFRAIGAQRRAQFAGAGGGSRPARRGLFGPRTFDSRVGKQPSSGLRSSAASRAQARVTKSKQRHDAEAVARGAELARARAKASKSRRAP